jgi:hypothetical protein
MAQDQRYVTPYSESGTHDGAETHDGGRTPLAGAEPLRAGGDSGPF